MFNRWTFSAATPEETADADADEPDEAASTSQATLQEAREAARVIRAVTRNTSSRVLSNGGHLAASNPQALIRSVSRSRSPSPSPTPYKNTFTFPTMDEETVERITANAVRIALQQDRDERDRQSQIATTAAVAAALANQTSQVQALRRPDLPPFDPQNIDIWIKRIEFAYTRSGITAVKDKFAFLEKLFHAKDDARVNAFLWGDHTADNWKQFLEYLRERYGRTRKQEVYSLLNGVPREGRRPTVLADHIRQLTPNVSVDDIRKEVLLKEFPAEVRQHLSSKIDEMDFDATAKAADKFFDKQGKLRDSNTSSAINHVDNQQQQPQRQPQQPQQKTTSFTSAFPTEEDSGVNAVRFRQGQRQQFCLQWFVDSRLQQQQLQPQQQQQ